MQNKMSFYILIYTQKTTTKKKELDLIPFFVARCLFWLHVEKVHLASEGGQEVQDQTMFGHLQYQNNRSDICHTKINYYIYEEQMAFFKKSLLNLLDCSVNQKTGQKVGEVPPLTGLSTGLTAV